jgi:hypothetical protein
MAGFQYGDGGESPLSGVLLAGSSAPKDAELLMRRQEVTQASGKR